MQVGNLIFASLTTSYNLPHNFLQLQLPSPSGDALMWSWLAAWSSSAKAWRQISHCKNALKAASVEATAVKVLRV